jgi:hypothetical protein
MAKNKYIIRGRCGRELQHKNPHHHVVAVVRRFTSLRALKALHKTLVGIVRGSGWTTQAKWSGKSTTEKEQMAYPGVACMHCCFSSVCMHVDKLKGLQDYHDSFSHNYTEEEEEEIAVAGAANQGFNRDKAKQEITKKGFGSVGAFVSRQYNLAIGDFEIATLCAYGVVAGGLQHVGC